MYNVSNDYHNLIKNGAEQNLLITFEDMYVMASQGDIESDGASFDDFFNTGDEIKIGEVSSNVFSVNLMNVSGLLSDYSFGIGKPFIGVMTGVFTSSRATGLNAYSETKIGSTTYYFRGRDTGLTINNVSYSTSPVHIIWSKGTRVIVVTDSNLEEYQFDATANAWVKSVRAASPYLLAKPNGGYSFVDGILKVYKPAGLSETWEYCPLGVFRFEEPVKRQVPVISLTAYDKMTLFDKDATEFVGGNWVYPITLEGLFQSLCQYVGLEEGEYDTGVFTNSDMSFTALPTLQPSATCRTILSYIAEAAGAVAKFDRDGVLRFKWYTTEAQADAGSIALDGYEKAEYITPSCTRLMAKLANGTLHYEGTGDNTYTILANSFVGSDSERFAVICEKIASVADYHPTVAEVILADPSVEAGDLVTVLGENIPLMSQNIRWSAKSEATYSALGNTERNIPDSLARYDYAVVYNSKATEDVQISLSQTANGIMMEVNNAKGEASEAKQSVSSLGNRLTGYEQANASAISTAQNVTGHIMHGVIGYTDTGTPITGIAIGENVTTTTVQGESVILKQNLCTISANALTFYVGEADEMVARFSNTDTLVNGDLNIEGTWKWFVEPDGGLAHRYIRGD